MTKIIGEPVSRLNNQPIQKKNYSKVGLPEVVEHPEIFQSTIPARIHPRPTTQAVIQEVMTPAATSHQIQEGLMIKAL